MKVVIKSAFIDVGPRLSGKYLRSGYPILLAEIEYGITVEEGEFRLIDKIEMSVRREDIRRIEIRLARRENLEDFAVFCTKYDGGPIPDFDFHYWIWNDVEWTVNSLDHNLIEEWTLGLTGCGSVLVRPYRRIEI